MLYTTLAQGKLQMNEDFAISPDKSLLNIETIYRYLSEESYWAKGRSLETVRKSIEHSLCFGVYDGRGKLVGFARVVSDQATFAYLMDVFVLEEYRGRGLGKQLVEFVLNCPELKDVKRWQLATADAHGLYARYGFVPIASPDKKMEMLK